MSATRRRARAAGRLLWVASCALLLGGLSSELWLQLERRAAERDAQRFSERNVFDASRPVTEGATLWEVPGERYRPGARLALDVAGERYAIEINSHGFRDRERERAKPAGSYRVVCVGGSTTVQGRTNAETYPALLERLLDPLPDGRRVEVLNLGVNGTGSGFWLDGPERAAQLFAFQPDLVVQYSFVNDFFWEDLPRYARRRPWRAELGRSLLASRLLPLPALELDPLLQRTLIRFREMHALAREHGAGYLAGSFAGPDPERAERAMARYLDVNTERWGTPLRLRWYRDYHRARIRYLELFDRFARRGEVATARVHLELGDPALYVDLCHMTPEGIARLAQAFAPEVLRLATHPPEPGR